MYFVPTYMETFVWTNYGPITAHTFARSKMQISLDTTRCAIFLLLTWRIIHSWPCAATISQHPELLLIHVVPTGRVTNILHFVIIRMYDKPHARLRHTPVCVYFPSKYGVLNAYLPASPLNLFASNKSMPCGVAHKCTKGLNIVYNVGTLHCIRCVYMLRPLNSSLRGSPPRTLSNFPKTGDYNRNCGKCDGQRRALQILSARRE